LDQEQGVLLVAQDTRFEAISGLRTMTTTLRGGSQTAEYIQQQLAGQRRHLQESTALGSEQVLRDELAETWEECSQPNWDGYDALPVTSASFDNAKRLLLSLPLGTRLPSIGAIPRGHISLEWHHSRRRTLTVTVDEDGNLHYAALLGPGRTCGTEPFFDETPQIILDLIARVYQC
jgi:hypothetical protein